MSASVQVKVRCDHFEMPGGQCSVTATVEAPLMGRPDELHLEVDAPLNWTVRNPRYGEQAPVYLCSLHKDR